MINNIIRIITAATKSDDTPIKVQEINEKQLSELCYSDYSVAFKKYCNKYRIYKGFHSDMILTNLSILTPGERVSQNTNNIYTTLFSDILPSWKDYPPRNKSFICTSDYSTALAFGQPYSYVVLPKNGTNIGICPMQDIWLSFRNSNIRYLREFIEYFNKLIKELTQEKPLEYSYDANKLIKVLKRLNNIIKNNNIDTEFINNDETLIDMINYIKQNKNTSILEYLNKLLDPKTNGFKLTNIENYNLSFNKTNNEVWFSNDAIFIKDTAEGINLLNGII